MAIAIRPGSLVLEPVVEVLPSNLDPDSEPPPGLLTEDQRRQWMQNALDRTGLGTLSVYGCWALARDIVELPGACEVIVRATLRNRRVESRRDEASSDPHDEDEDEDEDADEVRELLVDYELDCGIAIRVDGLVRAWPECCADWGALGDLRGALDMRAPDERTVWIGHDGGAASIAPAGPEDVTLRTWRDERGEPDEWLVARTALVREIEAAWDVIDRFEAVARPLLDARLGGRTLRLRERRDA